MHPVRYNPRSVRRSVRHGSEPVALSGRLFDEEYPVSALDHRTQEQESPFEARICEDQPGGCPAEMPANMRVFESRAALSQTLGEGCVHKVQKACGGVVCVHMRYRTPRSASPPDPIPCPPGVADPLRGPLRRTWHISCCPWKGGCSFKQQ